MPAVLLLTAAATAAAVSCMRAIHIATGLCSKAELLLLQLHIELQQLCCKFAVLHMRILPAHERLLAGHAF